MAPRYTAPAGANSPTADLVSAVQSATADATGNPADTIIVDTVTEDGEWAYGTATVPAGPSDSPTVKFFLARLESGGWTVALRYTEPFPALLAQAPGTFPTPEIRRSLEGVFSLAGDGSAQMSFPFPAGETWYFMGPHEDPDWHALDFAVGDFTVDTPVGTIVAMRGGTVYRPCGGMVMIDHGDGWVSGYYHVDPISVMNGQTVARGEAIGVTSMNYDCGGYAGSNHVHVWTEYLGVNVAFAGQDIGGWTVENGPDIYYGCLVKGADRRCRLPTGAWNNYVTNASDIGSGGQATVETTGSGFVGDLIDYTLSGFPAQSTVAISWKRPGGSTVDLGTIATDVSGAATGQITIPATTNGGSNLLTFAAGATSRTVRLHVIPKVTVSPQPLITGGTMTITVTGFPKQQAVNLSLGPATGGEMPVGSLTTNNTGGGKLTAPIPSGLPVGVVSVVAQASGSVFAITETQHLNGPTITVPTNGQRVGMPFSYSITLFPANTTVTLEIREAGSGAVAATLSAATTDASGSATGNLTWPLVPSGQYRIVASANGTIAERLLTLSPALVTPQETVQRGSLISLTAHGMAPGSAVIVAWMADPSPVPLGSAQADTNGTATMQITAPAAQDGPITLRATDTGNTTAFASLAIAGGPMPGPAAASVSPTRTTVNNWVNVSIVNFPANSAVQVAWIRTSGGSIDMETIQTDGLGSATGRLRVPATPGGLNSIRFVSGATTATVPFEVVARIKVTPAVTERGGTVDVSLRGFGKKEVVRIRWKQGNSWVELARVTTSNTGSANISITAPDWVPDGATSVRGDGTSFRAQTNAVTIAGGTTLTIASEPEMPSPTATLTEDASPAPDTSPSPTATPSVPLPGTETPTPLPTVTETPSPSPEPTETATPAPTVEPTETVTPVESVEAESDQATETGSD